MVQISLFWYISVVLLFFRSLLPSCKTVHLKEFKVISSYKGETIISSYMRNFYFEFHVGILAICFDYCCEIFPGEGEWGGGMGGKFILFSSLRQEIQLKKLVDQIFVVFNLKNKKKEKTRNSFFFRIFLTQPKQIAAINQHIYNIKENGKIFS